jgi:hypothetical protein
MGQASFHIRRDPGHGAWVVEEEAAREIGGIFATLIAALSFVDDESRRFRVRPAIERSSWRPGG